LERSYKIAQRVVYAVKFSSLMDTFTQNIFNVLEYKRRELVAQGREVINLSVGTPNLTPSRHVMEAMAAASCDPECYKYSLVDSAEMQDAVIGWYKNRYGVSLDADGFTSVYGTQEGVAHMPFVFCNPGETVIIGAPAYPIFAFGPMLAGAKLYKVLLKEEDGFLMDFAAIPPEVAEKAKMIIVSYPSNPLAAVANDDFYERLIAFAKKYGLIVIHDNAYSEYIHDGNPGGSFLQYRGAMDVGVEFNSLSKSYNLTGLRISFALGNKEIITAFRSLRSQIDYGISYIDQKAAVAALNGPQDILEKNRAHYKAARDALYEGLNSIGWKVPLSRATMFSWLPIPEGRKSEEFTMDIIEKAGVMFVPGTAFGEGGEGYVRAALVADVPTLKKAVRKIAECGVV